MPQQLNEWLIYSMRFYYLLTNLKKSFKYEKGRERMDWSSHLSLLANSYLALSYSKVYTNPQYATANSANNRANNIRYWSYCATWASACTYCQCHRWRRRKNEKAFFKQERRKKEGSCDKELAWIYKKAQLFVWAAEVNQIWLLADRQVKTRVLQISVGPEFHFRNGNTIKGKKGSSWEDFKMWMAYRMQLIRANTKMQLLLCYLKRDTTSLILIALLQNFLTTIIFERTLCLWVLVTHRPKLCCRAVVHVFKWLLHHLQKEVLWSF